MFSLCITNYNRYDMLLESFQQVIDNPLIDEIVICDDHSELSIYYALQEHCLDIPKVRLFRNDENVGMGLNKKIAIEHASNEYAILFDSDNILTNDYIHALARQHRYPDVILTPDFAKPQFDYRRFDGWLISQSNILEFLLLDPMAECLLNTCNYVVHCRTYLKWFEHNPGMQCADTIWFNYCWLKAGNYFEVVRGMQYEHRVHPGSGFLENAAYNMQKSKEVLELIKKLPNVHANKVG